MAHLKVRLMIIDILLNIFTVELKVEPKKRVCCLAFPMLKQSATVPKKHT